MNLKILFSVFSIVVLFMISCSESILLRNTSNIDFTPIAQATGSNFKSYLTSNKKIISTGTNDLGLNIYDPSTREFFQLSNLSGAGTRFFMDKSEENIVFQTYSLIDNKKYNSILKMKLSKESKPIVIEENKRNLKLLGIVKDKIIYLEDDKIVLRDMITLNKTENPENIELAYSDNDLNLVVLKDGNQKILNPMGKGNYIWVSIAPDNKHILFHKAEKGTFICDLKGKNLIELGNINNPKWVPESNWIFGTEEIDDGHVYLKSDIILFNSKDKTRINLTANNDIIALYPSISSGFDKLVFNDQNGKLYWAKIKDLKNK
jgi:hypothetical protein